MPMTSKSLTITEGDQIPLETVGEILKNEFLEPLGVTPYRLAVSIGKPQSYVGKILDGGGVSADMGLRLDRFFGLSDGYFSRLQADYDTRTARKTLGSITTLADLQAAA